MASVTRLHVSHGRGLAAVYPAWLRQANARAPERFARIGALLADGGVADVEREIGAMIRAMGLADHLGGLGFVADDVDTICANLSGNLANDPIDGLDAPTIRGIVVDALSVPSEELQAA